MTVTVRSVPTSARSMLISDLLKIPMPRLTRAAAHSRRAGPAGRSSADCRSRAIASDERDRLILLRFVMEPAARPRGQEGKGWRICTSVGEKRRWLLLRIASERFTKRRDGVLAYAANPLIFGRSAQRAR